MTNWNDFGNRFKRDRAQAHAETQLAAQKQAAVQQGQADFWQNLRNTALNAVNGVNQAANEKILLFHEDIVTSVQFEIIYPRAEQRRAAIVKLRGDVHTIEINAEGIVGWSQKQFQIQAGYQNHLEFVGAQNRIYSPDAVIELVLSMLL